MTESLLRQLAIHGGRPVRTSPMPSWPTFEEDEIQAATSVMRTGKVNYWTGQEGREFEREFAASCECEHGVAVMNGTVALELALHAVGIGAGDEVIVTPRTFIASTSCAVMRGCVPVMADVDPATQNISAETIEAVLTSRTKAIIPVHLAGWPCDMDKIVTLARKHNLKVIEDCAQAQGARLRGRPVGSFGHAAAFSFCQDKIMTTAGEGGMLVTNDRNIWSRAWSYKDHGKSYDSVYNKHHPPGFRWLHESFGTNWRMIEIQASIGRKTLPKVASWIEKRRMLAERLISRLKSIGALRIPVPTDDILHAYYRLYVFIKPEKLKPDWTRDKVMAAIASEGVPAFSGSCSEIYLEKAFAKAGFAPAQRLPVAKELGETSLAFLVHPTISVQDIDDVANAVEKVLAVATSQ